MLLWKRKMIICEDQVRNRKIDLEAEMLTVLLETIVLVVQPREETNRNPNLETDIPDLARGMYNGSKQAVWLSKQMLLVYLMDRKMKNRLKINQTICRYQALVEL